MESSDTALIDADNSHSMSYQFEEIYVLYLVIIFQISVSSTKTLLKATQHRG